VVAGVFAFNVTPALAKTIHVFDASFGELVDKTTSANVCTVASEDVCQEGEEGSGNGQFKNPTAVAVNSSTSLTEPAAGDVYVVDKGNNRVERFSSTGAFLGQFDGSGAFEVEGKAEAGVAAGSRGQPGEINTGKFSNPEGIAVDNSGSPLDASAGDVYVVDTGHDVIDKFSPLGAYLGQITTGAGGAAFSGLMGVAVDPSGTVWAYVGIAEVAGAEVDTYSDAEPNAFLPARSLAGLFANSAPGPGIAVDSEDHLYVYHEEHLAKLRSTGFIENPEFNGVERQSIGVAVDPSTGHVYVGGFSGEGTEKQVEDFASSGVLLDAVSSSQLTSVTGIGVNSATNDLYVADASGARVDILDPVTFPNVLTEVASALQRTSAVLNGTVEPEGPALTQCEFEYISDAALKEASGFDFQELEATFKFSSAQIFETFAADTGHASCENPGAPEISGFGSVAVHADVGGLQEGTTYHFRLIAANASGPAAGEAQAFATTTPPKIDAAAVLNLTATAADLTARINPDSGATTYHLEYGPNSGYGITIPVPDASIGEGSADVPVTQHIAGLSANVTYHWRVVATNEAGVVGGADHTFVYDTAGGGLPDNRAYEMVTPPQKNGALIGGVPFAAKPDIAEDGSRMIIGTLQCFAGAVSCPAVELATGSPYAFTRGAGGWVPTPLAPAATQFETNTWTIFSANLDTALFAAPTPPNGEHDFYARQPDGAFLHVGPLTPPEAGPSKNVESPFNSPNAATADLSHFVYSSAPVWPFDASQGTTPLEYAGSEKETPFLVGVSGGPTSNALISSCTTKLGAGLASQGALSVDGHTVYFTAVVESHPPSGGDRPCPGGTGANQTTPVPVEELYARVDGGEPEARTVAISQPRAPQTLSSTPADENCTTEECQKDIAEQANWRDGQFVGASADGSQVFFTDTQQLTDDATEDPSPVDTAESNGCSQTTESGGCNLYLYDSSSGGHGLIDASACDACAGGARVQGVMAVSGDGSRVYFVAKGVLTGGANDQGQSAHEGSANLYVFERDASLPHGGRVAFIAALPLSDSSSWTSPSSTPEAPGTPANVTPDGRFLVFSSSGDLTADDTATNGAHQIFEYDAQSRRLVRVSIGEHGFNDNGNTGVGDAAIVPAKRGDLRAGPARTDPTMSHDGAYVFFMSPVGLTTHALNDVQIGDKEGSPRYAQNVYEYHEGTVSLISDGHDASVEPSELCNQFSTVCLLGSDATGSNVFFATADPLLPQDTDTQLDIYDARICTPSEPCLKPPPPVASGCLGEACHGTPPATPGPPDVPTSTFNGAGNAGNVVMPPPRKAETAAQKKAKQLATALKRCRKDRNTKKRRTCEKQARTKYGPTKARKAGHARRTRR
jgi:hypothetical protein